MAEKTNCRSSKTQRRKKAVESFGNAASAIGPIEPGMSLFCLTRGQWSMIDAVLHCLDCLGPSRLSIWTWTIAEYEVEVVTRLRIDERLIAATLVIDHGARNKNAVIIDQWQQTFGPESVRYVINHAKIATLESADGKTRLCLRGSMNLNFNPRFENFDVTEGGEDFDLVRRIESELPVLQFPLRGNEVYAASKVGDAFEDAQLKLFSKIKVWAK